MAENKKWTHLKLKNGDTVQFIPPDPDGTNKGGISSADVAQITTNKNDILLKEDKNYYTQFLNYTKSNNQITITGLKTGYPAVMIIPEYIEGCPVTSIGNGAFSYSTITNIKIPDSVTSIATLTFSNCRGLTSITIPNKVTNIGMFAFSDCIGLTSVTIPNGVTSIGMSAFNACNALANVYYEGTETQWNAITKGSGNEPLQTATKHYNQKIAVKQDIYDYHDSTKQDVIQFTTMPTPSAKYVGKIVQYIGATTTHGYTQGYFYKIMTISGIYIWAAFAVQPSDDSKQSISNIVWTIDSSSTNSQYPSAKAVYDYHDITKENSYNKTDVLSATGTEAQTKYPSVKAVQDGLSLKQNITDNSLNTTAKTIPGAINEVNSVAKGAQKAVSMLYYSKNHTTPAGSSNGLVEILNALPASYYSVGQTIYLEQLDIPDVWIYSNDELNSIQYNYVDDSTLIAQLQQGAVQMGYHKVAMLETLKQDLTNYVKVDGSQSFTDAQKLQGRTNIGAVSGAKLGGASGTQATVDSNGNIIIPQAYNGTEGTIAILGYGLGNTKVTNKAITFIDGTMSADTVRNAFNNRTDIAGTEYYTLDNNRCKAITYGTVDFAVKQSLVNPKLNNANQYTSAEKTTACSTIGAATTSDIPQVVNLL